MQIFNDKINKIRMHQQIEVKEHFAPFNIWEDQRLRSLMLEAKQRILNNEECLIREKQAQPFVYLLLEGKLRVERMVSIESLNYWPQDTNKTWVEKKVTSNVLFKIMDLEPHKMFGERECIY